MRHIITLAYRSTTTKSITLFHYARYLRAVIMSMHVTEILKFKRSFLKRLKEEVDGDHSGWERFVTRRRFRKSESNIYAVRKDEPCTIKYVETADSHLILRPHNPADPIQVRPEARRLHCGSCVLRRGRERRA